MNLIKRNNYLLFGHKSALLKPEDYFLEDDLLKVNLSDKDMTGIFWKIRGYLPLNDNATKLNLPLLPDIDQAIIYANEIVQDNEYDTGRWYGRIEGFAANGDKKYTQEDMRKAWTDGRAFDYDQNGGEGGTFTGAESFDDYMKTLPDSPTPMIFIPEKDKALYRGYFNIACIFTLPDDGYVDIACKGRGIGMKRNVPVEDIEWTYKLTKNNKGEDVILGIYK